MNFSKPDWIFYRTYDFGTPESKTLITNTSWFSDYVLDCKSSDIWHVLPKNFSINDLSCRTLNLPDGNRCGQVC